MNVKAARPLIKSCEVFLLTNKYLKLAMEDRQNVAVFKEKWAQTMLDHFKIKLEVKGRDFLNTAPTIFVGNHISYLDILLLVHARPSVSFLSKEQVKYWPVFGSAAQVMDTVFVRRGNANSRKFSRQAIEAALIHKGQQIAVFPSGTTSTEKSPPWRRGAFQIAAETRVKITPFRIRYNPLRAVAYIGRDFFPYHLFNLIRQGQIEASIEFHEPVNITDPISDCHKWQEWSER